MQLWGLLGKPEELKAFHLGTSFWTQTLAAPKFLTLHRPQSVILFSAIQPPCSGSHTVTLSVWFRHLPPFE